MSMHHTHAHAFADAIKEGAAHAGAPLRHASDYVKGLADDANYTLAQLRGERLAKKMQRDGSLDARSPRKVIRLPK